MDLAAKKVEINLVLSEPDVDLWKLRELCLTEGGLCEDTLRKRAWPKLVGLHGSDSLETPESSSLRRSGRSRIPRPDPPSRDLRVSNCKHPLDDTDKTGSPSRPNKSDRLVECLDADQIGRDVTRASWHLLNGSQRSRRLQMENKHRKKVANLLRRKQIRLENFINLTLVQSNSDLDEEDQLRYYQGFHDVACVFLSALGGGGSGPISPNASSLQTLAASMGLDLPSKVLGQVAKSHFRDAMRSNFIQLQVALRLILFPLLARFDPEVHAHLYYCDMEPFFALPWVITWFSHDIRDTALVKRLFDAFIVSHPLFPLYLSAAMILHPINRREILDTDCDFASVHQTLAGLPKNSSMVGWKFKVTDGYMTNDGDEEGSTATTDMDSTFLADEFLDLMDDDGSDAQSMISSNLSVVGSSQDRVPFQELIDTALSYMRRVPPRKLMGLAKRYFAEAPNRDFLFDQAKSISLLQPPPSWGLATTVPADWVIKQRLRENRGMKATNRRDRRSRSRSKSRTERQVAVADANDKVEIEKYLDEKQKTLAVIACGFGPGDDDEERRRKRRKLLWWGAVAAALVAVSYAVITQNPPSEGPAVGTPGESSGNMERDLLETTERPVKSALNTETQKQSKIGTKRDSPMTSSRTVSEKSSKTMAERNMSRQEISEVFTSQRGLVESIPTTVSTKTINAPQPESISAQTMISARNTSVTPKASVGMTNFATDGTRNVTIPAPLRFMKDLLLHTRQLANDIDEVPGALWAQSVYNDLRHAFEERDPNLVPGAGLLHDFVRKARNIFVDGDGARLVQGTISDARDVMTTGKGRRLAQDFVRNARHFLTSKDGKGRRLAQDFVRNARHFLTSKDGKGRHLVKDFVRNVRWFLTSKDGQGARLVKAAVGTARAALTENEAEVVVL